MTPLDVRSRCAFAPCRSDDDALDAGVSVRCVGADAVTVRAAARSAHLMSPDSKKPSPEAGGAER